MTQGSWLAEKVSRQQHGSELITGYRGSIFDRNGQTLARSVEVRSVYVRPYELEDMRAATKTLAPILGMSEKEISTALSSKKPFVWVKRKVDDNIAAQIRDAKIKGVDLATEFQRVYPFKQLAGQLLGFVNIDDVGLEGLEKTFDNELTGHSSRVVVQRDAAGRSLYLGGTEDRSDLKGEDIVLTIDTQIQYFTEEALAKAVTQNNAKWGGCLVVDVPTGEILAWAEFPFFNPNAYRTYKDPSAWRARLATDALEQGSTIKPLLVAAALTEDRIKPDSRYYCEQGIWKTKKFTIRDTHGRGWLTVDEILRYSSNIGSAKIGMDMGAPLYHSYLDKMGFGQRSYLPVIGESTGILRNPKQWAEVDLATASFGQSFSATALQMAEAYLILASGGVKRPLKLVKDFEYAGEDENSRIFSQEASETVLNMLYGVVEEDGTGQRARIPGISVGGKTGTAQKADEGKYGKGRVSSFIGIAPLDNPKYLVITMVDEPQKSSYGGVVAAPVFRQVVSRAMAYRGELPDAESLNLAESAQNLIASSIVAPKNEKEVLPEQAQSQPETSMAVDVQNATATNDSANPAGNQTASNKTLFVPCVTGKSLRGAVEDFMSLGLKPVIKGQGYTVVRQLPEAGIKLPENSNELECVLWLSEQGI